MPAIRPTQTRPPHRLPTYDSISCLPVPGPRSDTNDLRSRRPSCTWGALEAAGVQADRRILASHRYRPCLPPCAASGSCHGPPAWVCDQGCWSAGREAWFPCQRNGDLGPYPRIRRCPRLSTCRINRSVRSPGEASRRRCGLPPCPLRDRGWMPRALSPSPTTRVMATPAAGPPFARYHRLDDSQFEVEAGFPLVEAVEGGGIFAPRRFRAGRLP